MQCMMCCAPDVAKADDISAAALIHAWALCKACGMHISTDSRTLKPEPCLTALLLLLCV
jgi:hypothetical protein